MTDYGVQNEDSNIRVHVCPIVRRVYVFLTADGKLAIQEKIGIYAEATQPGVGGRITGTGRAVPYNSIKGILEFELTPEIWDNNPIERDWTTNDKGRAAERIFAAGRQQGLIHLPPLPGRTVEGLGPDNIEDPPRIEVKCDYLGGRREKGGTGNLFLQTWEENPLQRH